MDVPLSQLLPSTILPEPVVHFSCFVHGNTEQLYTYTSHFSWFNDSWIFTYFWICFLKTVLLSLDSYGLGRSNFCRYKYFASCLGNNCHQHVLSVGPRDYWLLLRHSGHFIGTNWMLSQSLNINCYSNPQHMAPYLVSHIGCLSQYQRMCLV